MIAGSARPKLAPKVRLRFDRHSDQHWLVYPERGLALNETAARVAALCTGQRSIDEIVSELHASSPEASHEQIAADVQHFLGALQERALIQLL
jgi:pyrroloquinoline quinone biosynthesis protein D